ncbi:hypothetical protein EHQ68_07205 [Leptospira congkakensis]|uniref:Uncharacterized protein n=1 Tax=Leptospira congkakensis TaxID=2484932 RepID=A0A4Z1A1J4_9LEPT|nr:hypothetical protein [Leptospira congkakensis]TGL87605.1 hypothetical protein EHQ69_15955 [Leptospira congkakensis]TGL89780.1 hypothetical protein EHQ68_07205 [Leptospira congkakensis]TGL95755.1 hypothetical protein EHQ70_11625 [Leptospira congkakensis]
MKYFYLSSLIFYFHCSFANLDRNLKPFSKESTKAKISDTVTILNQNRMYFQPSYRGLVEYSPPFGDSPTIYFSKKQEEIGRNRYQWKEISIHNIDEKEFQLTNVKTDYVFFVTATRPRSDWDQGSFKQVLQLVTFCIIPCKQKITLDVTVKLYHKNSLVSEKVSSHSGTRYLSPWYMPFPFLFEMRDYGNLSNEPSIFSTLYLNGFQDAIDEIYLKLPKEVAEE